MEQHLRKRIRELEQILEFYANDLNYDSRHGLEIFKDCGKRAKKGLMKSDSTNEGAEDRIYTENNGPVRRNN